VLFRMLDRFRPDPLRAQIEESIRAGTGLRKAEWLLPEGPRTREQLAEVSDAITAWCREQMHTTRRPYGIDQMALAVACAEPGGTPIASATFGVFRPVDFYRDGGVNERIVAFFDSLPFEAGLESRSVRFAAALFSWGDVARDTIFKDDEGRRVG